MGIVWPMYSGKGNESAMAASLVHPASTPQQARTEEETEAVPLPVAAGGPPPQGGSIYGASYYASKALSSSAAGRSNASGAERRFMSDMESVADWAKATREEQKLLQSEKRVLDASINGRGRFLRHDYLNRVVLAERGSNGVFVEEMGKEFKATALESVARYVGAPIGSFAIVKGGVGEGGRLAMGAAHREIDKNDDVGSGMVSGALSGGAVTVSSISAIRAASPIAIGVAGAGGRLAIGTAAYAIDVVNTGGRATIAVVNTVHIAKATGVTIPSKMAASILHTQAVAAGLNRTHIAKTIIAGVKSANDGFVRIGNRLVAVRQGVEDGVAGASQALTNGVDSVKRGARVVRNTVADVATGKVAGSVVAYNATVHLRDAAVSATVDGLRATWKPAVRRVVHVGAKVGTWTVVKGLPKAGNMFAGASLGTSRFLTKQEDYALQGSGAALGLAAHGAKLGVGVTKLGYRTLRSTASGSMKTVRAVGRMGRTVASGISFARAHGARAARKKLAETARKGLRSAGRGAADLLVKALVIVGKKLVVPILLLASAVVVVNSAISAPAAVVSAVFGGVFGVLDASGGHTEYNFRDFLLDPAFGLPVLRADYISDLETRLSNYYVDEGGDYHIVRLYSSHDPSVVGNSAADIEGIFIGLADLTNVVLPIFNAVILMDYELMPTEDEALFEMGRIFDMLFRITESEHTEYCGQNVHDGEGTPIAVCATPTCAKIHALSDCPNRQTDVHTTYTCSVCCSYYCPERDDGEPACNQINYFTGGMDISPGPCPVGCVPAICKGVHKCVLRCGGLGTCGGHNVKVIVLDIDGLLELLYQTFEKPIEDLRLKDAAGVITYDEVLRLNDLVGYREICLEYINLFSRMYGSGMTMSDLEGIDWDASGGRIGKQDVVDLALSQVGQVGGYPYWSYYGFRSRVAWCACFTHWVYNTAGYGGIYGTSTNNANERAVMNLNIGRGTYVWGECHDLAPGDLIFLVWDGGTLPNHIGLVIGCDDNNVYTVEGNSGDAVKIKGYPLTSTVIHGYAIFNP